MSIFPKTFIDSIVIFVIFVTHLKISMEKIKNTIKKNLRMQNKTQSFIAEILKITQASVSQKINGNRKWEEWEIEELKSFNLL